jgi:hypothetical protein
LRCVSSLSSFAQNSKSVAAKSKKVKAQARSSFLLFAFYLISDYSKTMRYYANLCAFAPWRELMLIKEDNSRQGAKAQRTNRKNEF